MTPQTIDLKRMSVIELKALAYDFLSQRDLLTQNIQSVNNEISIRAHIKEGEVNAKSDSGHPGIETK